MILQLWIPSNDRNGEAIPASVLIPEYRGACGLFSLAYGGCTIVRGLGYWRDDSGVEHIERVRILSALTAGTTDDVQNLRTIGLRVLDSLKQASVLIAVDNEPEFLINTLDGRYSSDKLLTSPIRRNDDVARNADYDSGGHHVPAG